FIRNPYESTDPCVDTSPCAYAERLARAAIHMRPTLWRSHVVMGAIHCCRYEWSEAEKSFERAIRCSPELARYHSWYCGYLLAIGRVQEALNIARERVERRPDDVGAYVCYGLYLYVTRDFEGAFGFLRRALYIFHYSWLIWTVMACVQL